MIAFLDDRLGAIMQALQAKAQLENTIIVRPRITVKCTVTTDSGARALPRLKMRNAYRF